MTKLAVVMSTHGLVNYQKVQRDQCKRSRTVRIESESKFLYHTCGLRDTDAGLQLDLAADGVARALGLHHVQHVARPRCRACFPVQQP